MSVGKRLRFEIFKRDGFTCQYCGRRPPDAILECDHIDPRAAGGSSDEINLITSCADCNRGKSDKKLGDIHPRPDADLKYFEAQQEIAEAHRYLKAAAERDAMIVLVINRLERLWATNITDCYKPTDKQWRQWLSHYSAEEVEYGIAVTMGKFAGGRFGDVGTADAVDQAIRYISGVMKKARWQGAIQ